MEPDPLDFIKDWGPLDRGAPSSQRTKNTSEDEKVDKVAKEARKSQGPLGEGKELQKKIKAKKQPGRISTDTFGSLTQRLGKEGLKENLLEIYSNHEKCSFKTEDGLTLEGMLIKPNHSEDAPSKVTYLFCSGSIGTVEEYAPGFLSSLVAKDGHQIFLFNYRGFGDNFDAGEPTPRGLYLDAKGALEYLKLQGIPEENIVVYGYSLGGPIAAKLAEEYPVRLYLDRTFTTIGEAAAEIAEEDAAKKGRSANVSKRVKKFTANRLVRLNTIKSLKKTQATEIRIFLGNADRGKDDKHVKKFQKVIEAINQKKSKKGQPEIPAYVRAYDKLPHIAEHLPKSLKQDINATTKMK